MPSSYCKIVGVGGRTFADLLGAWPTRVAPAGRLVDRVPGEGYVRERVTYEVEPGERVAAFVLVPKATGPHPAVFAHHQHADDYALGKSEVVGLCGDPEQALGVELVRRGYVVLAPDAVGFEERNQDGGTSRTCAQALARRLLVGQTLLGKALHDVRAGLDYLQTRDDVQKQRLGFIGHSYGGRMAIWAAAFDQRLTASVSHCGALAYEDHLVRNVPVQPEFVVPSITATGDLGDVAAVHHGALLISSTDDDRWSPSAPAVYDVARRSSTRVSLKQWPGGHVFTREMRDHAYDFLDRHLRG